MRAHNNLSERNQQLLRDCNKHLNNGVDRAKNEWAEKLAKTAADYKTDPVKSWKVVRTLGKGLSHHHSTNRTIRMQKKTEQKQNQIRRMQSTTNNARSEECTEANGKQQGTMPITYNPRCAEGHDLGRDKIPELG
eukprot:11873766-Ditylum_brightwellii.AAC.1